MSPEDQHRDAVQAAHEWTDEERRKQTGGWLSGGCADDAGPGTFVVYEERPVNSTEPRAVREGNVVWVDGGSGPGFMSPVPDGPEERR